MKKFRRILSMLLCAAMLLGVVMLSACDKNTDDNGSDGNDDRSTESGVTVQAVRLKNSLEKGEIISAKDIEVVDEKESDLPKGYITKRVDVIGKKMLEAETSLRQNFLQSLSTRSLRAASTLPLSATFSSPITLCPTRARTCLTRYRER